MKTRIRTVTSAGLLASQLLTGCTSWKVVEVSPRALVDSAQVKSIRVTEKGGETYFIKQAQLLGDTLVGTRMRATYDSRLAADAKTTTRTEHRVAFTTIEHLAVRRISAAKTAGLVGGLGLIAGIYAAGASISGNCCIRWGP